MGQPIELLDPRFKLRDLGAQPRNLFKQLRRIALLQGRPRHSFDSETPFLRDT